MEYETPEDWLNRPEEDEENEAKPLPKTRQASGRQYYDDQSGPVSGFYENYDPIPPGQMYPPQLQYPGQPHTMEGHDTGSNQWECQTPRPGQMPHMPEGYYGPPFGYPLPYQPHPTQTGADGDHNVQGQGPPNMQGQMPYGLPPQYYVDKQGRPINFQMGMPMSIPNPSDQSQTEYESRVREEISKKDYMDGDTDLSLEEPRPTKIIVTGIPSGAHDEYLQMFFDKKGECEPLSVEIDEDGETEVIIEFKSPDAVNKVLQHRPIKILGVEVDVEMYIPEPDQPLCTIVVEGPASLMDEEMLELYFQNKRKSGGDYIVDIQIDENHAAYITFESEEVAQRVVEKGKHKMNNNDLCVRLLVSEKKKRAKRQTSNPSTDIDSEPENLEPIRTIEVRGPSADWNEELLELYFENKRKSGGGPTEKIEIYEDVAYITFETEEVAERVANKQGHKISKLAVTVELYNPYEEEQEPPRTIRVSGMRHITSHEAVEMYFENRRRADGGPIEGSLRFDTDDDNVAYITFESHEVAHAVANRAHSVDNCDLEVSLHLPGKAKKGKRTSKGYEEEIPEPTKCVKVKGMKKVKSTSNLEYYFENNRRSGGGIHYMETCEEDEDIAFITFDTHEVAKAVSERTHCIEGVTLTLCLYTQPKPPPQYDDRVLIKGVKSTTTKDCLFNFLEANFGFTPQSLVHGEKEGDILVVFESCQDFDKLDHISKNIKLEGASLKMSRVAGSNGVLVSDLPSNTTRDTIQFYFENHRRSGGGPVLKVDVNKEDDSMIVFFEDYKVAESVSQRSHKIGDATIKVDLYLSCIGRPQGDRSEPCVAESNCVLVSDLPSNSTRDTIQFYFENYRRSGGGTVLKIDVNQEDDSMIVFFEDYKVAKAVTQRKHKLGEATLRVDLYFPCIGIPKVKEDQHMEVSGRKRHESMELEVTDSDEIFEQFCDPCREDNKEEIARGFCIDCNEYLCDACFTVHNRPRPFRHHVLQDKKEMPKQKPTVKNASDPSICDNHGEEIKFYCRSHKQPCCGACVTFVHKTCDDVIYLERQFEEIRKTSDEIDKLLDENTKTKNQHMHNIGEHFSYSINAIAYFRKEIKDFFDKLEACQINQANEIKTEDQHAIESMSTEFGQIKDELKSLQKRLNDLYKSKQNVYLFSAMDEANAQLKQLSQRLNKLSKNNKIRKCQFIPEKKIKEIIKEVGELGKLYF